MSVPLQTLPEEQCIILASTHETDEDLSSGETIVMSPGIEYVEGYGPTIAINCWELSIDKATGELALFSYAPINEHYPSYPRILFDAKNARELLAFLDAHRDILERSCQ